MTKTNAILRSVFLFLLLPILWCSSLKAKAQAFIPKTQHFDWVFYQYPFQSFVQGVKFGVERNANDRLILGLQLQSIQTEFPYMYMVREDTDPILNVILTPRLKSETMVQFHIKNYIGRYNYCFDGWYLGAFSQFGYGQGAFTSQLAKGAQVYHTSNSYRYNAFGVMGGRQMTMANEGVYDWHLGLGYRNMLGDGVEKVVTPAVLRRGADMVYVTLGAAFGIGHKTINQPLPRKPELRDSLAFQRAFLIDFNAVLHSALQFEWLHHVTKQRAQRSFIQLRSLQSVGINITAADRFQSVMIGHQHRWYPYADQYRNGFYLGLGGQVEWGWAEFDDRRLVNGEVVTNTTKENYLPIRTDFTFGYTSYFGGNGMVDVYASSVFTGASQKQQVRYARIIDAPGSTTVIGIKFGIAKFRRR